LRNFFRNRFFIGFVLVVLAVSGLGLYSVFSGGKVTPVANVIGVVVSPFQKAVTVVADGIAKVYGYFFQYDKLADENEVLKKQILDMQADIRNTEQVMEENERLRELLDMRQRHADYDLEMAEIIASETGSWGVSYTLDKGSADGIAQGNCVMVDAGIVGYITKVGATWSEMATIVDTDMQAGAIVTRTREVSVAEGDFELMRTGYLKLSYLPKDSRLLIGDTVETSGIGGLFPKGLLIGSIVEVKPEEHGISSYAVVAPAADLSKLNRVFVIKSFEITE